MSFSMFKLRNHGMSKNVVYKMRAALLKSGQRSLTCYSSLNLSSLIKSSCAYTANVSDRMIQIQPLRGFRQFSTSKDPDKDPNNSESDDRPKKSSKISLLTTLGLGASLIVGKTKYLFVALKLSKAAPLISMVLTSFAYSFVFGWPYAIGMVGLVFFHESGHALMMYRYGRGVSSMIFIPFIGAAVVQEKQSRNAYEEAMIALGGPALGSATALAVGVTGAMMESQFLYALADFGYMINLFNLLPIGMLDGGRVVDALHPAVGVAGLAGGGLLVYSGLISSPIFYLIMLAGTYTQGTRVLSHYKLFGFDEEEDRKEYYNLSGSDQMKISVAYAGLIAALLYAMNENNKNRKTPSQLKQELEIGQGGVTQSLVEDEWRDPYTSGSRDNSAVYDDFFGEKYGGDNKKN